MAVSNRTYYNSSLTLHTLTHTPVAKAGMGPVHEDTRHRHSESHVSWAAELASRTTNVDPAFETASANAQVPPLQFF